METTENTSSERTPHERPTVTKDKWIAHARRKLEKGYILIVGNGRRTANFYKTGSGYETCSYQAAVQMVRDGLLVKTRDHYLGTAYMLAPHLVATPPAPRPAEPDDDAAALLDPLVPDDADDLQAT
jgi:hypothetical protein